MFRRASAPVQCRDTPDLTAYRVRMHTATLPAIARRCHADLAATAEAYTREVRLLPGYARVAVTDDELYRTAHTIMDLLLRLLAGEKVADELSAVSEGIGRRRARQGLALDSLLRAVRMDFRFLWGVLRGEATAAEVADLSDEVATIWDAVELHTSRIQAAYIDELSQMNRELEIERASLLRRLLMSETPDRAQLEHVSAAFHLPLEGPIRVIVVNPRHSGAFHRALKASALKVHGLAAEVHAVDGVEFAVIDDAALSPATRSALSALPGGLSPAGEGLESLAVLWRIARRLADHVPSETEAATLADQWEHLVHEGLGPAAALFRTEHLAELDALPPERRDPILAAVREYLRSGSVAESSRALYLHRNTMLKRLQRFTELTGLDPSVPHDAGTIRVLLAGRVSSSPDEPRRRTAPDRT